MRPSYALALGLLLLCSCKRETRDYRTDPPVSDALNHVKAMPGDIAGQPPPVDRAQGHSFRGNAYQLSQGKLLFEWFNCDACHAKGGGSSGPALTNGWWRYGPDEVSIFLSIRDGRPQGMPAFATKLTPEQIWQLAYYVQTLGTSSPQTAATSRNDELHARPAENRGPVNFSPPKSPEQR